MSTNENLKQWLNDYPVSDLQRASIVDNHIIVPGSVDTDMEYHIQVYKAQIKQSDQFLYDENARDRQIHEENGDCSFYKLEKLKLSKLYNIGFAHINNLDIKQIIVIHKQRFAQEFRNTLRFTLSNGINPQENMEWLDNIINRFRLLRNNNRMDFTQSIFIIELLSDIQRFVKYFQSNPFNIQKAIKLLLKINPSLMLLRTGIKMYLS